MSVTQKEFDEECDKVKNKFDELYKKSGQDSLAMAMIIGPTKNDMTQIAAFYEGDVIPAAKDAGLIFKTTKELLGVEISFDS